LRGRKKVHLALISNTPMIELIPSPRRTDITYGCSRL
jgi:hypothetical protein